MKKYKIFVDKIQNRTVAKVATFIEAKNKGGFRIEQDEPQFNSLSLYYSL